MDDRRPTRRALLAAGAVTAAAAVAGCGNGSARLGATADATSAGAATTSGSAASTGPAAASSTAAPSPPSAAAPPAAWAVAAAAGESNLVASYDAVIKAHPGAKKTLAPLRAAHAAHLKALRVTALGKAPAGLAGSQAQAVSRLVAAEEKASATVAALGVTCPVEAAALLGSIAAADASHVLVLQSIGSA